MTILLPTIDAPTCTYHLVFKHLRGWYMVGNPRPYLTGGGEYTRVLAQPPPNRRVEVEELLTSTTEPLPYAMHTGHRFASAAYVASEGGLVDVGISIIEGRADGNVPRNALRRVALTNAIAKLHFVDRAYFHIYISLLEGRDLIPILRRALPTRDGNNNDVLTTHLLGRYRACCKNPGGISTAHGGKYRVFLEDRFNQAHPTHHP